MANSTVAVEGGTSLVERSFVLDRGEDLIFDFEGGGGGYSGTGSSSSSSSSSSSNTSSGSVDDNTTVGVNTQTGKLEDIVRVTTVDTTNVSIENFENYPNTVNDGSDNFYAVYLTSYIEYTGTDAASNIKKLIDLFHISNDQATKLYNSYNGTADSPIAKIFINNVKYSDDLFNHITYDTDNNWFKYDNNDSNNRIQCGLVFKRNYQFASKTAILNKNINLKNSDFQLMFKIDGNTGSSIQVKYADIHNLLWFVIESYYEVADIRLHVETNQTANQSNINLLSDNYFSKDAESSTYDNKIENLHTNYSDSKDNHNIIEKNDSKYDAVNSDYFFNAVANKNDSKYTTAVKLFLSDGWIRSNSLDNANTKITKITAFIKLSADNIDAGEAISTNNAFRVFANTHSTVDFIKYKALYEEWNPTNDEQALIGIYRLNNFETDFNGNISVFYGNQILYQANNDISNNNEIIINKPDSSEYSQNTNALYYDILRKDNLLYVYLKTTKNVAFRLKKFVTVNLSDISLKANDTQTTNVNSILSQDNISVHNIDISIPQVSKGDSIVFIDNGINNKTKHYSYYTKLDNGYYGVRAVGYLYSDKSSQITADTTYCAYFDNELYSIGIPGLSYNVNAKIVKLYPEIEHRTVYSFTNGEQMIYLNTQKTNLIKFEKKSEDSDFFKISDDSKDLLPFYRYSYEYIVSNKIPDIAYLLSNTDYNFRFYPTHIKTGWVPISEIDMDNISTKYEIHIPYNLSYKYSNDGEYVELSGLSENYPLYRNFDDDNDNNLYEYKYLSYSSLTDEQKAVNGSKNNIFEKVDEYVKIPSSSISFSTFKQAVRNSENEDANDNAKYYKYIAVSKSYVPYTSSDLKDLNNVPLNLYVKYEYYLKSASTKLFIDENSYVLDRTLTNIATYDQWSTYSYYWENPLTYSYSCCMYNPSYTYLSYIDGLIEENSYVSWSGFKKDGSGNYYGYIAKSLSLIQDKINAGENVLTIDSSKVSYQIGTTVSTDVVNYPTYYLKQKYTQIYEVDSNGTITFNLSKDTIDQLRINKIDIYTQSDNINNVFLFTPINEDETIFNIDVSGNTIYAFDENRNSIFDLNDIKRKYYSQEIITNIYQSDYNRENILREKENSKYLLSNFKIPIGPDQKQSETIKYTVSLDGNYKKVENYKKEFPDYYGGEGERKINPYFVRRDGYNKIPLGSRNEIDKYKSLINILKGYNIIDKLYLPVLSELSANDLADTKLVNNILTSSNIIEYYAKDSATGNGKSILYFYRLKYGEEDNYTMTYLPVDMQSGIIENFDLYKYNQEYTVSYDLHTCMHKKYFELIDTVSYSSIYIVPPKAEDDTSESPIVYDDTIKNWKVNKETFDWKTALEIDPAKELSYVDTDKLTKENAILSIKDSDVKFYGKGITDYKILTDKEITDAGWDNKNVQGLKQFYGTNVDATLNYKNYDSDDIYTCDIFYKTKFFYEDFSTCSNIGVNTDGTYFVNILVFDSYTGKSTKKLTLNHHIYDVVRYSYVVNNDIYIPINNENYDFADIDITEYNNFFLYENREYVPVLSTGNSIEYYISNNVPVYRKIVETTYNYYNNDAGTNQLGNPYLRDEVCYIKKNDDFYGLIFANDPNTYTYSYTISFGNNDNPFSKYQDQIFSKFTYHVSKFDPGDTRANGENVADEELIESALVSANNELYYNNVISDSEYLNIHGLSFIPSYFKYDIVPLSIFTFRNYNSDNTIIQSKKILDNSIIIDKPFSISNEQNIEFTGTYNWIPPKYKNIISDDGTNTYIIEQDGYFEKSYNISTVPFKVTSYNYYPKNEISSINITYSFIPNSYVISSVIEHPDISYNYMVNTVVEEAKYSYILNGFEYDYLNTDVISYENGTYYGIIQILDIEGNNVDTKISLYKRNVISTKTDVKNILHQKSYTSYEYFSYLLATPLTNEKIPVLYNTEIIPASSKQVKFWNEAKHSYQIKTVIDSYAYYSYKYRYETIPFKVASYIYTDDLRISNFNDLGSYLDNISYSITRTLGVQSKSINDLTYDLSYIFRFNYAQDKVIADKHDDVFSTYSYLLSGNLRNFDINISNTINSVSSETIESINNLNAAETAAISNMQNAVVDELIEHRNVISTSLEKEITSLDNNLSTLNSTIHTDIIGDGSSKEITTTRERTTYTPVVNEVSGMVTGYTYNKESESETTTIGGKSLGEILASTLGSVSKQTHTQYNADGSYVVSTSDGFVGIGEILANLTIGRKIPNYKEFMSDLVPKLFSGVDFEGNYEIEYDVFGNVKSKKKRNPTDIAKKCVMRADILWKELKKNGIV